MPLRFLIAPDKFKGSLSASQAAAAIAEGVRRRFPDAEIDLCPIADGGEGFMETLAPALDARWIQCRAVDALGRAIEGRYLLAQTSQGPTAVMEMAEASGMWRLSQSERNPLEATTKGTGQQIAHAIATHQVKRIILGLGGSATNDGGCGMAAALGVRFLDNQGGLIETKPSQLMNLSQVCFESRLTLPVITAACDVENPLLGPNGATAVFSRQKGAGDDDQRLLEKALAHMVDVSGGNEAAITPGAGAAGGLGFGLLHFADAKLVSGFELLAGLLDLKGRIAAADHVLTGEGSLDHQSLSGKGPVGLAHMARDLGKPITAYCGQADTAARESGIFNRIHALADSGQPFEILVTHAARFLAERVENSLAELYP